MHVLQADSLYGLFREFMRSLRSQPSKSEESESLLFDTQMPY